MDLGKVEKMLQLMRNYGLHEMEIKDGDSKVRLVQSPSQPAVISAGLPQAGYASHISVPQTHQPAAPAAGSQAEQAPSNDQGARNERRANLREIRSPFVGTYYSAPAPGADEFVKVGQKIRKGDTLCIVEAMKLMNEIEAEQDGVIAEILVENEEPVEYDQVLFLVE